MAGWTSTVFAHESPTRLAGFDAENRLYLFALTVPARSLKNSSTPMDSPLEKPDIGYVDTVDQEVGELVARPTGGR
jgi:hypothetical protein